MYPAAVYDWYRELKLAGKLAQLRRMLHGERQAMSLSTFKIASVDAYTIIKVI